MKKLRFRKLRICPRPHNYTSGLLHPKLLCFLSYTNEIHRNFSLCPNNIRKLLSSGPYAYVLLITIILPLWSTLSPREASSDVPKISIFKITLFIKAGSALTNSLHNWLGRQLDYEQVWRRQFHDRTRLSHKLDPGQNRGCFLKTRLTDCLIITAVHSDINQHPSLASCNVLVPGTGRRLDLVKHVKSLPVSGSLHELAPMTIPPPLPSLILWRLCL